nr:DUF308 domain-containing protein [uncultured Methanoregula sp.]
MDDHHHLRWKSMIMLGLLCAIVGVILLFFPGQATLFFLQIAGMVVILLSAIFLVEGLFIDTEGISKWVVLCLGIAGVIVGIFTIAAALIVVVAAGLLLGIFLILFGIGETILGLTMSIAEPMVRFVLAVLGILAIVVGVFLLLHPAATIEVIAILVGLYLFVYGLMQVSHGLNERQKEKETVVKHL